MPVLRCLVYLAKFEGRGASRSQTIHGHGGSGNLDGDDKLGKVARNSPGRGGSRTSPVVVVFSCLPTFSGIWEPRGSVATLLVESDGNGPRSITNVAIGKHGAVVRQLRVLFDLGAIRELTDGQLLERFASSDGEAAELAFAALVERHGPMVLRVCRGVLSDPHASQDAFQATFLVLVQKARGLWVRDSLGPWLYQVAFRTASCARLAAARRHRHERSGAALRKESCLEAHDDELERAS